MTALLYALGVLLFVFAILASIGLHELGHLVPAKTFGCKITQYFVGFGPTVWSKRVGETECGVKAIPLGGYVKIVGMLPPGAEQLAEEEIEYDDDGRQVLRIRRSNTGLFTQLISDARAAEWELVAPEDSDRLFYKMPVWKKVTVMSGGPMVNIAIAFFCFWAVFATFGDRSYDVAEGAPVISRVSECMIPYAEQRTTCEADDPPTPAFDAGLEKGDRIVAFNGTKVTGWEQFRGLIQANDDGTAVLDIVRDGKPETITTTTNATLRPTEPGGEVIREVGFLGVSPEMEETITIGGPLYTLDRMGGMTVTAVEAIAQLPVKVWDVVLAIAGVQERDPNGPVSIVGGSRFAGEAVSVQDEQVTIAHKAAFLVTLTGGFNLFIGLFNFVPLLPLDGGHIAGALWEGLRRRLARLLGRPDPGHVDVAKLLPVAYVFGLFILVLGVVLIVGDLVVPIRLT